MATDEHVFTGAACEGKPDASQYKSQTTIGPGQGGTSQNYRLFTNQPCVDALENGSATYTINGVITYDDIF